MDRMQQKVWFPRTKLIRPQPPADLVVDPALVARVAGAAETVPLTIIRGTAGAGKTTLAVVAAAEIAATLGPGGDVGWVRLDELDDDPASLLDLLLAAFDGLLANGCPGMRELLAAGLPASLDPRRAAGVLVNDLLDGGGPDPAVVVLDDLHALRDEAALAVLDYFVAHLPPSAHLVATSRTEPGLSLSQLRARRQVVEIVDDDLRLGVEQAERLLNERLGQHLTPDEVADIVDATGGWVTGVRLHGSDPAALDRYIDDELVAMEADDVVSFLVESSVLDVLTPDACLRVTGRPDAAELLARVHRTFALFVSIVDQSAPAYRLHDLFLQHLRNRLATWPPSRVAELHRSAAATVDSPARQIEHLLTAGAWDDAADRIDALAGELPRPAELGRVEAWAGQLPSGVRSTHPGIGVLLGTAATRRGDLGHAVPLLEDALDARDGSDDFARTWLAVRTLHLATNDHARFLPLLGRLEGQPAFAALPAAAQADHHISLAYGARFGGAWDEAARRVDLSIAAATSTGDPGAIEVLAQHLSPILVSAPGVAAAIDRYASWVADRDGDGLLLGRLGVHHQRAYLAFFQARFDDAVTEARAAAPLIDRLGGLPYLRATIEWVLAGVAHAAGDDTTAERVLRDALDGRESGDLDRELDVPRLGLLARVLARAGRVDELVGIVRRLEGHGAGRYADFAAASVAATRAHLHLAKGDAEAAIQSLDEAVALEDHTRVVPFVVLPRLELAIALDRAGRRRAALDELATAVSRVRAWGTPGLLAAAGEELAPLLAELGDEPAASMLATLHEARAPAPVAVPGTSEVLSAREVEVLRLLASGATNAEIASSLVISAHTAKTHVAHILTKLGARTRGAAVARARAERLI